MKTLTFQNITLTPVKTDDQIWLSSADLARALGYSQDNAVAKIYNRNADEFTPNMTQVIDISETVNLTAPKNQQNLVKKMRIFSLRGCHLIAMFARTAVAKEFRQWVLDILDKEVGQPVQDRLSTTTDRKGLVHAVNRLSDIQGMTYSTTWKLVHDYMNVESVDELTVSQIPVAVAYVHRLMMADNTPNLNISHIQSIISDTSFANKKAQAEIDGVVRGVKTLLNHIEELQDRLTHSERCVMALQRFIA